MPVLGCFSKPASTKKVSAKICSVVSLPGLKPACFIGAFGQLLGQYEKGLYIQLVCIGNLVKRWVWSYGDCQLVFSTSVLQLFLHVSLIPGI